MNNKFLLCAALLLSTTAIAETVFITGSNRGLGLGYATAYAERGWQVIASSRSPGDDTELQALAVKHSNVTIEQLDVTDHARIDALAIKYQKTKLDLLINNAGILPTAELGKKHSDYDYQYLRQTLEVNAIAPLKITSAFFPQLQAARGKAVNITSYLGSLTAQPNANTMIGYRASKAALNQYMRVFSNEVKGQGVAVVLLHPGYVATQGGALRPGQITVAQSIASQLKVIDALTPADSGRFMSYTGGEDIPW